MKRTQCYCCCGQLALVSNSSVVEVAQCPGCGSLLTEFPKSERHEDDPWQLQSVTPTFLEALRLRRDRQAGAIIKRFGLELRKGKLLDYGCGQGAFVLYARGQGLDAAGCDISSINLKPEIADSFVALSEPWEIPDLSAVRTISFLDVLEHVEHPDQIVDKLFASGVENVLIKVPMLHGPIGLIAHTLARFGKLGLLHRLLLVDEPAPHYSFFTSKGLKKLFEERGFVLADSVRIADVGSELPQRLRGMEGEPSLRLVRSSRRAWGARWP